MRLFVIGYPGDVGGANTEAWHTIKLWRSLGLDVHLIPTWSADQKWRERLDTLGCTTHIATSENVEQVQGLAGSVVVGFCNSHFMALAPKLRAIGCKLVWLNCMTFLFEHERSFFRHHGPVDAMIFQSEFQRSQLEPQLTEFGYTPERGYLIRGAFDVSEWDYVPRPHTPGEAFFVGRAARAALDKWSSNTWPIINRIQYRNKRAVMLGVDAKVLAKIKSAPAYAECLPPNAIPAREFYSRLHAMLAVNGGARENWPRAGLEAMAAGVPIVAQHAWGWPEMVEHGVTGFLGSCDEELAHYTAMLAYGEQLRLKITGAARERLVSELANADTIGGKWLNLLEGLK